MPVSPRPEDFPRDRALAFGERLAQARKAAGYGSQTALARAARLHPLTVHRHEKQGFMPARTVVAEYARLLGVTEQWLLYGADDPMLDLPDVVREYLLSAHGRTMSGAAYERLARIPWDLLTADYIDALMVHEVRLLVERNLAMRAQSGHATAPAQQQQPEHPHVIDPPPRRAVQLPLPRVHATRRQAVGA